MSEVFSPDPTLDCRRLFVGNVPFNCTNSEFLNCFKKLDAQVKAEIINRQHSNLSRGFGFVLFSSKEIADNLFHTQYSTNKILLKDRTLRFTRYTMNNLSKTVNSTSNKLGKFQIYITNFDKNMSSDDIKKVFSKYGNIMSAWVDYNSLLPRAVISVDTNETFENILNSTTVINDSEIKVQPYRRSPSKTFTPAQNVNTIVTNNHSSSAYSEGFKAGHLIGFQKGFEEGVKHHQIKSKMNENVL